MHEHNPIPEHRLLWAVLERAILDALGNLSGIYSCGERERATRWISHLDDGEFGFFWVCDHLGIDAVRLRSQVLQWKRERKTFAPGVGRCVIDILLERGEEADYISSPIERPKQVIKRRRKIKEAA